MPTRPTGASGGPTFPSANGAPSARITAPRATPGSIFRTITARSRAYRWGEDGLAGFSDDQQRLCLALALWNGRDPDSQGAPFRPDQPRRQSRRGREGTLLLSRLHADAFLLENALQVSAAGISLCPAGGRKPPPRRARSRNSSCSTPASSMTTAISMSSSNTPRPGRTTS